MDRRPGEDANGQGDCAEARNVLAELVKRAENVKSGITTAAQDDVIDHQGTPLSGHFDVYLDHLAGKGTTADHRKTTRAYLDRLARDCSFSKLADLKRAALERWLAGRAAERASARSRNAYRVAIVAFCNWCVSTQRLVANPLAGLPKANEKADPRRHRRALTETELVKLLDVARRRPLLDAMTIRRGERKGKAAAELRPETIARMERLGRERALIYKTLVLTGLRKGELASLTFGQLELDEARPYALLHAADEKNRQGSKILLRADLATDLRAWLADKLATAQNTARRRGEPRPACLADNTPLFTVPVQLVRILDRDLVAAGIIRKVKDESGKVRIDKRDGRGWTVDVHALRMTFGTLLSKGGVPLRTAQAAMRHSDPALTANVYTDPRLLDVAGALDALPDLPLDGRQDAQELRKTGTTDGPVGLETTYNKPKSVARVGKTEPTNGKQKTCATSPLVPVLVPTSYKSSTTEATAGKTAGPKARAGNRGERAENPCNINAKRPLSFSDNDRLESGRRDLNPRPLDPQSSTLSKLRHAPRGLSQQDIISQYGLPTSSFPHHTPKPLAEQPVQGREGGAMITANVVAPPAIPHRPHQDGLVRAVIILGGLLRGLALQIPAQVEKVEDG